MDINATGNSKKSLFFKKKKRDYTSGFMRKEKITLILRLIT